MSVQSWSTARAREGERFGYWHEAVCRAVLNVDTVDPPERGFFGDIAAVARADARFVRFSSAAHRIVRSQRLVRRAPDEHVLVSVQLAGISRIRQGDHDVTVTPGEVAILDGARPFEVDFPTQVGRMIAVMPRGALAGRLPGLGQRGACKLAAGSWSADLVSRGLAVLADPAVETGITGAEALLDSIASLLALAEAPAAEAAPQGLQADAMLAFARRHAADPDLDAAALAAQFAVSSRTVHSRFALRGTTLGRVLLDQRLDDARRALAAPAWARQPVSQIAYQCGFGDLSHFSKAFKARFGVAPRDWRAGLRPGRQSGAADAE